MDKIEKIRQEIERRRQAIRVLNEHTAPEQTSKTCAIFQYSDTILSEILSFLDTLETETTYDLQQYTPRPSVSIEDVAKVQFASHAKVFDKKRKAVFDWEQFKEVAGIFYGFGKKDSPETKEKKEPGESLEEAAENYIAPIENDEGLDYINFNGRDIKDAFIAGAEWQKKQMMKETVEGEGEVQFFGETQGVPRTIKIPRMQELLKPFKDGDKVRIIVIKEEEE